MDIQLKFQRMTDFTGRNGFFKCSGIDLMTISDNKVMITPLTSRGKEARCDIAIPMEDIPQLAEKLMELYKYNVKTQIYDTEKFDGRHAPDRTMERT